jgi:hypothetical protein
MRATYLNGDHTASCFSVEPWSTMAAYSNNLQKVVLGVSVG